MMDAEVWAIVGVGAVLLGVVLATWMASRADSREAHKMISKNIDKVETNLKENIDKVETNLKENIDKVHGDVRLLLGHALRGQSERPSETRQD